MTITNDGPPLPPGTPLVGCDEPMVFLNMRDWLRKACEAAGAKFMGGGIGGGEADIDVLLEGHHFNIRIRPLPKSTYR